jgi:hypothetical protein
MRPWIIVAAIVAASLCTSAFAQQKPLKDQLLGSWDLVSVTEDYGGNKVVKDPFGQSVKGSYSFDPSGRAMLMIIGDDLPTKPTKAQESSRLVVAWFGNIPSMMQPKPSPTLLRERRYRLSTGTLERRRSP